MNNFSIDEVIAYKRGCEDMQETYYKLLMPLYEDCVKLENEIREKINSAPNDVLKTPFILRVEWHATLRERTAFRKMLETVMNYFRPAEIEYIKNDARTLSEALDKMKKPHEEKGKS